MFAFLPFFSLAQTPTALSAQVGIPQEIVQVNEVRPLPGQLDNVPVFNSNSPELVESEGILLSTFPPSGKRVPEAHLNFPLSKRFDVFAHHVSRTSAPEDLRTLYLGVIVHNPGQQAVTIDKLQAASYLSRPEAPFIELPPYVANPLGNVFSGPGSRLVNDILRGQRQLGWSPQLVIPAKQSRMLMNLPIPARDVTPEMRARLQRVQAARQRAALASSKKSGNGSTRPPVENIEPFLLPPSSNTRSTLMHLASNGSVYLASLAMFGQPTFNGGERPPSLDEWQNLLETGDLVTPRDLAPTSQEKTLGNIIYGRVAGVARGSQWKAQLTDRPKASYLSIPQPGKGISYALSTVSQNTFGTGQVQSAPLLVRYPDTAYLAHGNYGIHYSLSLPLRNRTRETQTVTLAIQTPLKNENSRGILRFLFPPDRQVFFRGTVRVRFNDDKGVTLTRYFHLVQRRGQAGEPLIRLNMPKDDRRLVEVDFIYPPDATPPQVLTIATLASPTLNGSSEN
jgi:hypothetical protein